MDILPGYLDHCEVIDTLHCKIVHRVKGRYGVTLREALRFVDHLCLRKVYILNFLNSSEPDLESLRPVHILLAIM